MVILTTLLYSFVAFLVVLTKSNHKPVWMMVAGWAMISGAPVALIWCLECHSIQRNGDYIWDDWMEKKD